MAVVKLGAIITQIAGSIGGWTFRRSQGSTVVYNKPGGASKNRLLLNAAFGNLREVIQGWALLSVGLRNQWNNAAPNFLFPDKFGDLRALNGRSLYIKLTASNLTAGDPSPSPNTLDSTIQNNSIVNNVIISGGSKLLTMDTDDPNIKYLVQAERLKNESISATFTRREIIFADGAGFNNIIAYTAEFNAKFPDIVAGEFFNIYVTQQNPDGFRATTLVVKTEVI